MYMYGDLGARENAKKDKLCQPAPCRFYLIISLKILRAESYGSIPQFLVIAHL